MATAVASPFERMIGLKREAYALLDQALTIDSKEAEAGSSAVGLYTRALQMINSAIGIYRAEQTSLAGREEAVVLHNQLVRMRQQTEERLDYLKAKSNYLQPTTTNMARAPEISNSEFLEIADEILSDDEFVIVDDNDEAEAEAVARKGGDAESYAKLQKRLGMDNKFAKATEICRIDNGVQLYYIASDGSVSTPSHPTTLSIYTFNNEQQQADQLLGFIRVGSWVYPLAQNISPAMKTTFNGYIFPNEDEQSNPPGELVIKCNFVGITFAHSTREQQEMFEDILANYSSLIYQDRNAPGGVKEATVALPSAPSVPAVAPQPAEKVRPPFTLDEKPRDNRALEKLNENEKAIADAKSKEQESGSTADYIAKQLLTGADYVVRGVNTGTDYANRYINKGGEKIKSNLTPNEQATMVSPAVHKTLQGVRYGSHLTVRVSSFLLDKLGYLATATARTVAPYIREGSVGLLSKTGVAGDSSKANGYVDNFCTVTGSSIKGFVTIYDSLENAAKTLGKNITEQTVQVADHKYGPSVAKAAENGLYSVGNVAVSVNNVRNLKVVRTLAKATAKETILASDKRKNPTLPPTTATTTKSLEQ